MKKTGIYYGSTTGTTEDIAGRIAERLGITAADVHTAGELSEESIARYECLIIGTSTWGYGELQDDWYDAVRVLEKTDLSGKIVALFGCGDSSGYSDTFCDAVGLIYEKIRGRCTIKGQTSTEGYSFSSSKALDGDRFVGLVIDEMNESDRTDARIDSWTGKLMEELA